MLRRNTKLVITTGIARTGIKTSFLLLNILPRDIHPPTVASPITFYDYLQKLSRETTHRINTYSFVQPVSLINSAARCWFRILIDSTVVASERRTPAKSRSIMTSYAGFHGRLHRSEFIFISFFSSQDPFLTESSTVYLL